MPKISSRLHPVICCPSSRFSTSRQGILQEQEEFRGNALDCEAFELSGSPPCPSCSLDATEICLFWLIGLLGCLPSAYLSFLYEKPRLPLSSFLAWIVLVWQDASFSFQHLLDGQFPLFIIIPFFLLPNSSCPSLIPLLLFMAFLLFLLFALSFLIFNNWLLILPILPCTILLPACCEPICGFHLACYEPICGFHLACY